MIKLTADNVRKVAFDILDDLELWDFKGEEAEKQLAYIAGVRDMANAAIAFAKSEEVTAPE